MSKLLTLIHASAATRDADATEEKVNKNEVVGYKLLSQVHESVREDEKLNKALNEVVEIIGFDRDEVICTEAELAKLIESVSDEPLLEIGGNTFRSDVSAARGRGHERDFVRTAMTDQREREGQDYKARSALGLPQKKNLPDVGHKVVLGAGGIGQIVATDSGHGKVMIGSKGGKEFVVNSDQLVGPKMVGGQPTWGLKK